MQPENLPLPVLLALASEQLAANGYRVVRDLGFSELPSERALLAEDEYSLVAVVGYETWAELENEWPDVQAEIVRLLSQRLARSAPKAWDGYLLLLCRGTGDPSEVAAIERDTTRLRKIVATSQMLRTTADLSRVLDIFMPLPRPVEARETLDVLEGLPVLLGDAVPPDAVRAVVEAFRTMSPPLERLHSLGDIR